MLKRILLLLAVLSTSALAQNTPAKTTLLKAGRLLDVKAGVYLPNQAAIDGGVDSIEHGEAMVDAGLSQIETIRAATINVAELMGARDLLGSVEAGKFADMIAVAGDRLKDINELKRVKFVMKGGEVVKNEFPK